MKKPKVNTGSLHRLMMKTRKFIKEDRKDLLSYLDKNGLEALRERLKKEVK